jgi:PAS domain S-box-containing protein
MSTTSIGSSSPREPISHANEHNVQLYVDDRHLINVLDRYIGGALAAGERGIVVATPNHRRELSKRLLIQGFDLESLTRQGQYVMFDAAETLGLFMAKGHIDEHMFYPGVKTVFERVNQFSNGADFQNFIFGEMVALLWAAGKPEDAIRFENLWNQLAKSVPFSLLCAYPIMGFYSESELELFVRVCGEHSRLSLSDKLYSDNGHSPAAQMPADRRDFQKDLISHEAELRFQLLVEAARERAVFMIDLDGKISTWNPGAESMHGYTAKEVIGRRASFLDNEEDSPYDKFKSKFATAIERGSFEEECWRTRKDGSSFLATFTITTARNESGDLIGFAETIRLSRKIQWGNEPEPSHKRTCRTILLRRKSSSAQ